MQPVINENSRKNRYVLKKVLHITGGLWISWVMIWGLAAGAFATQFEATYSSNQIRQMIMEEATRDDVVPVALALAVARVESNFRAMAKSHVGARGVMQIMPATAKGEFGVAPDRLWNPRVNIRLGIRFLHKLYDQYGGRWDLALSHYNGGTLKGRGAEAIAHGYTRNYVEKVMRFWHKYARNQTVLAALELNNKWKNIPESEAPGWTSEPSIHSTDSYWLLEESSPEHSWHDYLEAAERILKDGFKEEKIFDGYDYISSVDMRYGGPLKPLHVSTLTS